MCNFSDNDSHCCEHHHSHSHEHNHDKTVVKRVLIAVILFVIAIMFPLSALAKLTVFLTAYFISGGDILLTAIKNIIKGEMFDENFLMGIATLGAFAIGEYPEAVMVMILYQTGEYLQHRAVEKSRKSVTELMDIRPDYANLVVGNDFEKISPKDVRIGDLIVVKAGEKIPLDGVVVEGESFVNTSALTGESAPRKIMTGDNAISGCINNNGLLKIRVEKLYSDSTVSKILELVEHAASKKSKAENFITKFARIYTPVVVIGAVLLAVLPPLVLGSSFSVWFERALTFLVISCPCALVISVPLGFFAGIGKASRNGILIKGSSYIEALSKAETVIFDKTGTLTKGAFEITKIQPLGMSEQQLIAYMAKAEVYSNHPIAVSLKNCYSKDIDKADISEIQEIAGNGISAQISGKKVLVGNAKFLNSENIEFETVSDSGTVVYAAVDGQYCGYVVISDEIKDDAKSAISNLKKYVKNIVMLTGDSEKAALRTAEKLGIKDYWAALLPAQKVEKTEEFLKAKDDRNSVIFVGDGINDAPVLTRADVGVAMGALGSDAAIEAADIVIMDDKPSKLTEALKISQKTISIVKQNIAFALIVKILFLLLGSIGFVSMWGAVFSDVGVTVLAVLNSLRLLK